MDISENLAARFFCEGAENDIDVVLPVAEIWPQGATSAGSASPAPNRASMIDLCRTAYPLMLEMARKQLGDPEMPVLLDWMGKNGKTKTYNFLAAYSSDMDDGTCGDAVDAVDYEDAEFQTFFHMAHSNFPIEESPDSFFSSMENMSIIELDDRPGLTDVLDTLQRVVSDASEHGLETEGVEGAREVLRVYGWKVPEAASQPSP